MIITHFSIFSWRKKQKEYKPKLSNNSLFVIRVTRIKNCVQLTTKTRTSRHFVVESVHAFVTRMSVQLIMFARLTLRAKIYAEALNAIAMRALSSGVENVYNLSVRNKNVQIHPAQNMQNVPTTVVSKNVNVGHHMSKKMEYVFAFRVCCELNTLGHMAIHIFILKD